MCRAANRGHALTNGLTDEQVVALAVYLLAGETEVVDTEDVAVKASELVPGRYTWAKYPDQIKLENVRIFLTHCKEDRHGPLLTGTGCRGWKLTPMGAKFARANVGRLVDESEKQRLYRSGLDLRAMERERVINLEAIQKALAGELDSVSMREAEAVFRRERIRRWSTT